MFLPFKNVLAEGSEEGASDLINWYADGLYEAITHTGKSEWETMIREIQAENPGMSRETAIGIATAHRLEELGWDIGGGMLSGGVMAAGGGLIGAGQNGWSKARNGQNGNQAEGENIPLIADKTPEADRTETQRIYEALGLEAPAKQNPAEDEAKLNLDNEPSNQPRYELRRNSDGKTIVVISSDILAGKPVSEWKSAVRTAIQKIFGGGILLPRGTIYSNRKGRGEFSNGSYTRMLERTDPEMYQDKMRMAIGVDGIVQNADNVHYENPNHERNDDIVGFNRGTIFVLVQNKGYSGDVLTAIYSDGKETFFDIDNLDRIKTAEKASLERYAKNGFTQAGEASSAMHRVSRPQEDVNSNVADGSVLFPAFPEQEPNYYAVFDLDEPVSSQEASENEWTEKQNHGTFLPNDQTDEFQSGARKTEGWEDRHAERYYEEIRHRKPYFDADRISRNVPKFSREDIEKIRRHVFIEEHQRDGKVARFDADYDIAAAWQRLTEGKNVRESDIIMLKHELLELRIMEQTGCSYEEAHEQANTVFNWQRLIREG